MKVLLILPPTDEKPSYPEPPAGLLYVASALKKGGHEPTILDIYRKYITPDQLVEIIGSSNYEVVGFGGITTCYKYVKEASKLIRQNLPLIHLIAGGVLSSAYDLLLEHTPIDVVCLREGEITAVNVINRLANGVRDFKDIKGVVFKKGKEIIKTPPQPYIDNLDDIPIPDYELINMDIYAFDAMKDPIFSMDISSRKFYKEGMRVSNIKTARGCTNACTFCYRHLPGYRQHSIDYVIRHIKHLQKKYNIHFFRFGDELFTRNKEWVIDFAKKINEENLKIKYIIHGVRTDNVDLELMQAIKMSGGIAVYIGFESGSQQMLNVMKKNVSVEQNIKAVQTIIESGLKVFVQTVIGMPSENNETILETIDALIRSGADIDWVSINYAQAYPGTWLWQYAIKNGIIKDKEDYLVKLAESNQFLLNYTSLPEAETKKWDWQIRKGLLNYKCKRTGKFIDKLKAYNRRLYSFFWLYGKYGLKFALKSTVLYILKIFKVVK